MAERLCSKDSACAVCWKRLLDAHGQPRERVSRHSSKSSAYAEETNSRTCRLSTSEAEAVASEFEAWEEEPS